MFARVSGLILAGLISTAALAKYNIPVPELTGRVVDQAGLLTQADKDRIEHGLQVMDEAGKAQGAVLITSSLQGYGPETYGLAVVEGWKLGHKGKDDGFLLLIAPNERKMRLEVGYGLEGDITDAFSRRVLDGTLAPYFREGRFGDGIVVGLQRIAAQHKAPWDGQTVQPLQDDRGDVQRHWIALFVLFWIWIFIIRIRRRLFWGGWGGGRGGWGGGGFGGGGFGGRSGGGFSGGGGSFGGGGSSSSW
ncbi:MAG TPA: TPM domain-containing protein [Bdellovibrionota bacterium]|jgi:uncharacterized protein|nr:TPM domain-containing protein [Bdellovibrionota bacterium]